MPQHPDQPPETTPPPHAPNTIVVLHDDSDALDAALFEVLATRTAPSATHLFAVADGDRDRIYDRYQAQFPEADQHSPLVVDATRARQFVEALYETPPTIYLPDGTDPTRFLVAIAELLAHEATTAGGQHVVIRDLAAFRPALDPASLGSLLARIDAIRPRSGLLVIALDTARVDDAAVAAATLHATDVLELRATASTDPELEPRESRHR